MYEKEIQKYMKRHGFEAFCPKADIILHLPPNVKSRGFSKNFPGGFRQGSGPAGGDTCHQGKGFQ